MKNWALILRRYKFTDPHGHDLLKCADFIDLLSEVDALRKRNKGLEANQKQLLKLANQAQQGWNEALDRANEMARAANQ